MPYVRGGTSQGNSGLPEVADVYHSNNVYANSVPIALWLPPGASDAPTSFVIKVPSSNLFKRPDTPPIPAPPLARSIATPAQKAANVLSASKPEYTDTEDLPVSNQPETKCDDNKPNVLGFLNSCLSEAGSGSWRETGQGGKPSNPNIINMWKNIGFNGFTSDQTPWCAGFACFAMKQSGLKWVRESGARNLVTKLGSGSVDPNYKEVSISEMRPGDLVLWSSGHVNFCYTANAGKYTFVGGNQMPGKAADPPVRDPRNDGDVTVSWPSGWTPSRGGISKVVRLDC